MRVFRGTSTPTITPDRSMPKTDAVSETTRRSQTSAEACRTHTRRHRRMPPLCRGCLMEACHAVPVPERKAHVFGARVLSHSPQGCWHDALAYQRAILPCRAAVLSSPSSGDTLAAAVGRPSMHGGEADNFLLSPPAARCSSLHRSLYREHAAEAAYGNGHVSGIQLIAGLQAENARVRESIMTWSCRRDWDWPLLAVSACRYSLTRPR